MRKAFKILKFLFMF